MSPEIYENFLPDFYHKSLVNAITASDFPWYFTEFAGGDGEIKSDAKYTKMQYGFNHVIFNQNNGGITSNYYPLIHPMINAIEEKTNENVAQVIRIRIGLSTNIGSEGARFPHVDYQFPHKTLLYYLNDSDGDTIFYHQNFIDGEPDNFSIQLSHPPKENQAVLFDGLQYHSSGFPTKNSQRIAININFL